MKNRLYLAFSFLIVCLFNRPALRFPPEVQGFFSPKTKNAKTEYKKNGDAFQSTVSS